MEKIIMKSWRKNMEKISLTKLQVDLLGKTLKEAKANVDSLLEGNEIVFEIADELLAKDFYDRAEKIGVNCIFSK